jgi:hypothetical protein
MALTSGYGHDVECSDQRFQEEENGDVKVGMGPWQWPLYVTRGGGFEWS